MILTFAGANCEELGSSLDKENTLQFQISKNDRSKWPWNNRILSNYPGFALKDYNMAINLLLYFDGSIAPFPIT